MPLPRPIDEWIALHERWTQGDEDTDDAVAEAGEAFRDAFAWIDWRAFESQVVEAFAAKLEPGDSLTFREREDGVVLPIRNGVEYRVPLTGTGSDRYVMIHSLAEILKDRYAVLVPVDNAQADTHGFLVLTHAELEELHAHHGKWMDENLEPLRPGLDFFSGLEVPWYGHEGAAPDFLRRRAAYDQRAKKAQAEMARVVESALQGTKASVRWNAAEVARAQRMRQKHVAWLYLAAALVLGGFTFKGWNTLMAAAQAWTWVALLLGAVGYHAWVASRMKDGWRPNVVLRWVPIVALLVLAFSVPVVAGK